jgi:hypothetical protein
VHKSIKRTLFWVAMGIAVMGCSMMTTTTQSIPTPVVDLALSGKCSVPNVVGLDQTAAEGMLVSLGLQPVWINQYDSSAAPGTVVAQDPPAETVLTQCQGDVVVVISLGPVPEPSSTPASEQSSAQAPTPAPTASTDITGTWQKLTSPELGLSFKFPPLPGNITYEYNDWPGQDSDPSGTLVDWQVMVPDQGWTYSFAGCASSDMKVGREGWPTDSIRWRKTESGYFVDFPLARSTQVTPLRIVQHPAGTEGLIYDPNGSYWGDMPINPSAVDRVAILNLPEGYHPKIACLSFYFYDQLPLDQIEAVLLSVEFTNMAK